MRIGLYGLPTAGKSYVLSAVQGLETLSGSSLLKSMAPDFHNLDERKRAMVRARLARKLREKDNFIMDGHYAFGDTVVFTEDDGQLYDTFMYLYIAPEVLTKRMENSVRNRPYLKYDIVSWQRFEVESLRNYCHEHNKDFYVIDNPAEGFFADTRIILDFIDCVRGGYSCVDYAKHATAEIRKKDVVSLVDGDRTLIEEDSSSALGYKTHLFDGNFYSGFQAWRHDREQADYLYSIGYTGKTLDEMRLTLNRRVYDRIEGDAVILTTGYYGIWKMLAAQYKFPLFNGPTMCADTKYFVAKFLQEQGVKVIAFGDSMNDYYMLKQADVAFVVKKKDGTVSSSFGERKLEGFEFV